MGPGPANLRYPGPNQSRPGGTTQPKFPENRSRSGSTIRFTDQSLAGALNPAGYPALKSYLLPGLSVVVWPS